MSRKRRSERPGSSKERKFGVGMMPDGRTFIDSDVFGRLYFDLIRLDAFPTVLIKRTSEGGLQVTAPPGLPYQQIADKLMECRDWLEKTFDPVNQRKEFYERLEWLEEQVEERKVDLLDELFFGEGLAGVKRMKPVFDFLKELETNARELRTHGERRGDAEGVRRCQELLDRLKGWTDPDPDGMLSDFAGEESYVKREVIEVELSVGTIPVVIRRRRNAKYSMTIDMSWTGVLGATAAVDTTADDVRGFVQEKADWVAAQMHRKNLTIEDVRRAVHAPERHAARSVVTIEVRGELVSIDVERSARRKNPEIFRRIDGGFLLKAPAALSDERLVKFAEQFRNAIAERLPAVKHVPEPSGFARARPKDKEVEDLPVPGDAAPAPEPDVLEDVDDDNADDGLGDAPGENVIVLNGVRVPWVMKFNARRRRLAIFMTPTGVEVRAPVGAARSSAEDFLRESTDWVLARLPEKPLKPLAFRDGALIPFRGRRSVLRLGKTDDLVVPVGDAVELWLSSPVGAPEAQVRRRLEALLRTAARRVINDCWMRVMPRAVRLPKTWELSGARRRWGSCSAKDVIRLSWRLIALTDEEIEYVVAHELAHLVEFNHSARFWSEVERILPDWRGRHERVKGRTRGEVLDDV